MLTAFLALNLYRVLGKRTGHEQPLPKPAEERAPLTVVQRPVEAIGEAREPVSRNVEPKAEAGIRAIIGAD
ncbi:preprotein translocase subunit Tim44, partial [Pseudomonas sp. FW215-R2]